MARGRRGSGARGNRNRRSQSSSSRSSSSSSSSSSGGGNKRGSGARGNRGSSNNQSNNTSTNNNTSNKTSVSTKTKQGKERTPAQQAAAERKARGETVQSVKAAQDKKMREAAAERNRKFEQTRVQTDGGRRTNFTEAEKKRIRDAGYDVEGYSQAPARSDAQVAAHRKQQSQFSSDRVDTKKTYEENRELQPKYQSPDKEESNVAKTFVDGVQKIFKPLTPLPKSDETSTVSSKTFGLPTQSVPTGLSLFDQPSSNNQPDVEVAKTGGLNIQSRNRKGGGSNSSNSRTVDAVDSELEIQPVTPQNIATPTSNMPTPQDIAKIQADTYNKQMTAYGVPDYSARFQQTKPKPLKRKREYFNRDFFEQYL